MHSPGITVKSTRVGPMRPPDRHRIERTCRVMPRQIDFLSVGEEFGADCPGRTHCMIEGADIASGARPPLSSFLRGENYHQYREAKLAPPSAAGNTVDQNRLKPCREVVRPTGELESENQNGNPA